MTTLTPPELITQHLLDTNAYRDLEHPAILTSGRLGIFYINTERLLRDDDAWKEHAEDPVAMIAHANHMRDRNGDFGEVIDTLAEHYVEPLLSHSGISAISGGQRRDWLFSGPIATYFGLPHVTLLKDGRAQLITPGDLTDLTGPAELGEYDRIVHVSDLLTQGSSAYRVHEEVPTGWIPALRRHGATITDLIAVVDRQQGGRERIGEQDVTTHAPVQIDRAFLERHSTDPERALAYHDDPEQWTRDYLAENGALALLHYFDPNGDNVDRADRFLELHLETLGRAGKMTELVDAVKTEYGIDITQRLER